MAVRQRTTGFGQIKGRSLTSGVPDANHGRVYTFTKGGQITISDGNSHWRERLGSFRVGGPFDSRRIDVSFDQTLKTSLRRHVNPGSPNPYERSMIWIPHVDIRDMANKLTTSRSALEVEQTLAIVGYGFSVTNLIALGTKAVSQFSPLNSVADTSTTLAEFVSERKLFSVPGTAGTVPGEYLNYQFGVSPSIGFANDLRSAIGDRQKTVQQLARDSGRWTRRQGTVYEDHTNGVSNVFPDVFPASIGPGFNTSLATRGILSISESVHRKAWFSGAFTYHLPREGTVGRSVAELDKLYGVKPGVSTAWELLPYSWLADYKTSIGATMKNLDDFGRDGLVMPFGYIMGKQTTTTQYTWTGAIRDDSGDLVSTVLSASIRKTSMQRAQAHPFGFGILPGDLSGRQLSILAALGLSKI